MLCLNSFRGSLPRKPFPNRCPRAAQPLARHTLHAPVVVIIAEGPHGIPQRMPQSRMGDLDALANEASLLGGSLV